MRIRYGAYLQSQRLVCARVPFRAVLWGMWVAVGNLSMIGVIYGSDGSVGLSWSQHEREARPGPSGSSEKKGLSTKAVPLSIATYELRFITEVHARYAPWSRLAATPFVLLGRSQ